VSFGRIGAVAIDTSPKRTQSRLTRRRSVLAALVAVILLAVIGSVLIFDRDKDNDSPSISPSIERAQALFATAQKFDQAGRAKDAQATIVEAVQLYDELIQLDPDQNAPPLAPAIIQALGRAGVDFSVAEAALRAWLANPVFTPWFSRRRDGVRGGGWWSRVGVQVRALRVSVHRPGGWSSRGGTEIRDGLGLG
jgi:hypothetical protein